MVKEKVAKGPLVVVEVSELEFETPIEVFSVVLLDWAHVGLVFYSDVIFLVIHDADFDFDDHDDNDVDANDVY